MANNEKLKSKLNIVKNGIITNNPTFRLVLGTCPTLAITYTAFNGFAMGLAVIFVLTCSNMLISALRKVIPDQVRIPAFIVIIATFVTVVQMVMKKFLPDLYDTLGVFLPLIVVNCIILARAESFASVNTVFDSALDGIGMGCGFTLSLTLIGMIREFLSAGTLLSGFGNLNIVIIPNEDFLMSIFGLAPGGFLIFGFLMALINYIFKKRDDTRAKKALEDAHNKITSEMEELGESIDESEMILDNNQKEEKNNE